jgi:hypothetical protein
MSKSNERKLRKLRNQYESARLRFANGNATPRDMDMLARLQAEANGVNGYTGETRTSSSRTNGSGNPNPYAFRVTQPKDEHVFVCAENNEITGECPLKPAIPYILVPAAMWANFLTLADKFKTEWIALLKGKLGKDDKNEPVYIIDSFYFPPQTAGGTHVDIPTGVEPKPGTIGAIHSHVGMAVFFSGTDIAHSNWPVEIVINNRKEYKAVSRHQLKCGEFAKNETKVYLDGVIAEKETKALELAFQQGSALEKGLATPHRSQPLPQPQESQTTAIVPTKETTQRTGTTGVIDSPASNPNNSRICICGHSFGDHYRTDIQKTNFPAGILAGMCLDDICSCTVFREKIGEVIDLTSKPLTELERQAIIDADSKELEKGDPTHQLEFPLGLSVEEDPKSEETCEVCEGEKYVTEESGPRKITRICMACGGDGLSQLGKVRLAEMKTSMERMDG